MILDIQTDNNILPCYDVTRYHEKPFLPENRRNKIKMSTRYAFQITYLPRLYILKTNTWGSVRMIQPLKGGVPYLGPAGLVRTSPSFFHSSAPLTHWLLGTIRLLKFDLSGKVLKPVRKSSLAQDIFCDDTYFFTSGSAWRKVAISQPPKPRRDIDDDDFPTFRSDL